MPLSKIAQEEFDRTLAEGIAEVHPAISLYKFGWCQGMLSHAYRSGELTHDEYGEHADRVTQANADWGRVG